MDTLSDKDREIEELKRQLEEARAANYSKEVFLSNMSHDIRTPMNAIIGMTAIAKKHIDEKNRVQDALNRIETASGHLMNLLNDVLDMSRINSGKMQLAEEPFSISDLLHDTLTIIRPQMEQKKHTWRLDADDIEVEQLCGDATRLRQVYVNIITNAIKYTNEGGNIVLSVSEVVEGPLCHLIFRCTDNGIGMSEEFLSRIYEPFERVHNSTVSKIEGTGLGMSIVKKITDAMNGTISVSSRQGEGTDMVIDIPMRFERLKTDAEGLNGKNLLIIESDKRIAGFYEKYLGETGVGFRIVPSASAALSEITEASFEGRSFDAAIIGQKQENRGDIFSLASYLHKSMPDMPIILVSDADWEEIEYRANRSGIIAFIPLPFFRKSLINGLSRALHSSEGDVSLSPVPDFSGKHFLLVEDNMVNRMIALEILKTTNAEIDTADDGDVAVKQYLSKESGYYSAIFMDIQMPNKDGYAATREIRLSGRSDSESVPVFAMTANTFAEDIAKAKEAGLNGHIAKPVDINNVMHVLCSLR